MGGDLQGVQTEDLQDLKDAEVGRRLDRHEVAGLGGHLKRQAERLGAARRDDDLVDVQGATLQ